MNILKKISSIFTQIFMLLTIPLMMLSVTGILCFGIGFLMIHGIVGKIKDVKKESFIILEDNYNYGIETEYYTYTTKEKVAHDIYDNYGSKIGSYETIEDVEHAGGGDLFETKYKFISWKVAIKYVFLYPFLRIISLFLSILALFTNKFYIQISSPNDYSAERYSQFAHCYFDIVYRRSDKQIEKLNKEKTKAEKEPFFDKEFSGIGAAFLLPLAIVWFIFSILLLILGSLVCLGNKEKFKKWEEYLGIIDTLKIILLGLIYSSIMAMIVMILIELTNC